MTIEEKIKQIMDSNKELKRLVSEQNLRIQDWITEIRHAHGLLESKEYDKGIADAWEAARKVIKLKDIERSKLFDGVGLEWIMLSKSPSEVMQKLKDLEEKKKAEEDEIHVGDEVIAKIGALVGIFNEPFVVSTVRCEEVTGIGAKYTHMMKTKDVRKTGRHFPEMEKILERLDGESE